MPPQDDSTLNSPPTGTYHNPILTGFHPDPSIVRVASPLPTTNNNNNTPQNSYFLTTSTFDFFPGLPLYHSTDLISWRLISHVLSRPSQLSIRSVEVGGGVWAPTLRFRSEQQLGRRKGEGGVFFCVGSSFERYRPQEDERVWPRGWCVRCEERDVWREDGRGWGELVWFDTVGFDQDLFWDDDGSVYLSMTHRMHDRTVVPDGSKQLKDFAIHTCTVDLETGRALTRPRCIRSSSSGVSEGSHILKRGRYYYLLTAEGGTEEGHSEWVCRSEKGPLGPWEVGGKVLSAGTGQEDEVQNTGHVDVVEDGDGNWWCVLLAVRPVRKKDGSGWERSVFGRETFLIPMEWKEDWPVFNAGKKIPLKGTAKGLYEIQQRSAWRDDFDQAEMQLGWYRKSTPLTVDYSLTGRPGWLRLWGGPYVLSTPASTTMWLRKQQHRNTTWETRLDFRPDSARTEAGVVVWWNYSCYSSIGVRLSADGRGRVAQVTLANGEKSSWALSTSDSEVILAIECGEQYRLGFREASGGEATRFVGLVSNETMTRDANIGAPFTGMMVGLYAFGELEPCLVAADFAYAEFR